MAQEFAVTTGLQDPRTAYVFGDFAIFPDLTLPPPFTDDDFGCGFFDAIALAPGFDGRSGLTRSTFDAISSATSCMNGSELAHSYRR